MKLKYSEPKIEIRKYEISDIISASGDQAGAETNGQAPKEYLPKNNTVSSWNAVKVD